MSLRRFLFRRFASSKFAPVTTALGLDRAFDTLGLSQGLRAAVGLAPQEYRATLGDVLLHPPLHRGYPRVSAFLQDTPSRDDTQLIARRTHAAYAQTKAATMQSGDGRGIWDEIALRYQGPLIEALEGPDPDKLAALIPTLMRSRQVHGFGAGEVDYEALRRPGTSERYGTLFVDALVALAEAVGELRAENPEQGRWGTNLYLDVEGVARQCETAIGCDLSTPPVCGAVGLNVGGRLFMIRTPQYAYAVWRCFQLSGYDQNANVAEIGAGYGGTALIASRLGLRYTLFDLPLTSAIQAIFLLATLGQDRVHLFGEDSGSDRRIRLLPYSCFFSQNDEYRVVLNQDSMPEMPVATARAYAEALGQKARTFLSINQEAEADAWGTGTRQLVVSQLMASDGRLRRCARHPYWLRRGYVEEVYGQPDRN